MSSKSKISTPLDPVDEMKIEGVDIPLDETVSQLAAARRKAVLNAEEKPIVEPPAPVEPPKEKVIKKKTAPKKKPRKASPKKKAVVDGIELARLRRLERAGLKTNRCALLGIKLEVGSRANRWQVPVEHDGLTVSRIGSAILESGICPMALERAAAWLDERNES